MLGFPGCRGGGAASSWSALTKKVLSKGQVTEGRAPVSCCCVSFLCPLSIQWAPGGPFLLMPTNSSDIPGPVCHVQLSEHTRPAVSNRGISDPGLLAAGVTGNSISPHYSLDLDNPPQAHIYISWLPGGDAAWGKPRTFKSQALDWGRGLERWVSG